MIWLMAVFGLWKIRNRTRPAHSIWMCPEIFAVRRETGNEKSVQVRRDDGVAIHINPRPCVAVREGGSEASVGEHIGQPLSLAASLVRPYAASDVSQPGGRKIESRLPVRKSTDSTRAPSDLTQDRFQWIIEHMHVAISLLLIRLFAPLKTWSGKCKRSALMAVVDSSCSTLQRPNSSIDCLLSVDPSSLIKRNSRLSLLRGSTPPNAQSTSGEAKLDFHSRTA
jgi:hypothetical protein